MNGWSGFDFANHYAKFKKKSFQYSVNYLLRKRENAKKNLEKYKFNTIKNK